MKIQCGDNLVGELRLLDPRNDREPDNFNMLPYSEDAELLHDDPNWALVIQQIHHSISNNPLDFWAALDTIFMMAMHGFKVRAWGYNDKYVFVNGECLPDSNDQYGRFMFFMDVTTRNHWTPQGEDNPPMIRPAFDLSGVDLSQATAHIDYRDAVGNPIKLGPDEDLYLGTIVKKECDALPPVTIPTAEDIERFEAESPLRKKWSDIKVDLPTADQITDALMNPTGYFILMDEDGNPINRDKGQYYDKIAGAMGTSSTGISYSPESFANMDVGKLDAEIRALQAKFMGLPKALLEPTPLHISVRAHTEPFLKDHYDMPAHLAGKMPGVIGPLVDKPTQPIMSVSELMAAAERALSIQPVVLPSMGDLTIRRDKVRLPIPGDPLHYEVDFSHLQGIVPEEKEEDLNVDWDVLTDPTRFVAHAEIWKGSSEKVEVKMVPDDLDVLAFGTALYEPPMISHIPVVDKMGSPVLNAQVSPTRHHPKMDHPAAVTKDMIAVPADCDCIHCAQERAKAKGMVLEDHTVDALVTAFHGLVEHDMRERILDHNAIEGDCAPVSGTFIGVDEGKEKPRDPCPEGCDCMDCHLTNRATALVTKVVNAVLDEHAIPGELAAPALPREITPEDREWATNRVTGLIKHDLGLPLNPAEQAAMPDARKKELLVNGADDVPGYRLDHTVEIGGHAVDYYKQNLNAPETEIPTTDLDLEADPANWDGFLDDHSAPAAAPDTGDEER